MRDLLARISDLSGYVLSNGRRLTGGEQGGALLAESPVGPVVVKFQPDPEKAARVLAAARVMKATQAKWSVADWLAVGPLGDGAFHVQEFVQGAILDVSKNAQVDAVIGANRRQKGLAVAGAYDHSAQIVAVTMDRHPWFGGVARRSQAGARVAADARSLVAVAGTVELPSDDIVHGDLSASNIIVTPTGESRFVDAETVGRGHRALDLADLYRQCVISGHAPETVFRRLTVAGVSASGSAAFITLIVGACLNNLAWHAANRSLPQFEHMCSRAQRVFHRVEGDCEAVEHCPSQ
ncbi:phosphotransferase [Curtobacterium sp. MCLR17_007]|uniref:phosphotransferase family protein n=1 Tax=Curtobacterium sp. MCLR17_007 TaxID=2175648 RepID=UPI000DA9B325|nr:phosphotransferase [Curtobacterium sp. MCLR17_007]WIB60225.1 phosphotransferase [Curtobacterium sp. MCLR17_007]